jgi:hypothetical protein
LAYVLIGGIATLVIAPPLIYSAGKDLYTAATGSWWDSKVTTTVPQLVEFPFIGPPLPTDEDARDCVLRIAGGARLVWTRLGWRDPTNHPEPTPTGNPAVDRGRIAAWADDMRSYVGQYQSEFAGCSEEPPKPKPVETQPPEVVNYSGTYTLETQGSDCDSAPSTASVGHSPPDRLSMTLTAPDGAVSANGTVDPDGRFEGGGTWRFTAPVQGLDGAQAPVDAASEVRGQFVGSGDDMLIRGGILRLRAQALGAETSCTVSFSGLRQR